MLSTQSLREQMNRYAEGVISAEALEEWLASESWDMRRWAPLGVQRLVEAIQGAFIAHSDGKLSADDLAAFLRDRRTQLLRAAEASQPFKEAVERAIAASKKIKGEAIDHLTLGSALVPA